MFSFPRRGSIIPPDICRSRNHCEAFGGTEEDEEGMNTKGKEKMKKIRRGAAREIFLFARQNSPRSFPIALVDDE